MNINEEKQSFINKMIIKGMNAAYYIDDIFPINDISLDKIDKKRKGAILHFDKKDDLILFKREDLFDTSSLNETEFFKKSIDYSKMINKFKNYKSFSMTIKIDNIDKSFENFMLNKSSFIPFIKEFKEHKYEQFKNKKHIKVYSGINRTDYDINSKVLLDSLKMEPMQPIEVFSFLFDHFNPDLRKNSIKSPLSKHITNKLGDPSISLLRILYNSYIEDCHDYLAIGEHYIKMYELTIPPTENLNINGLIHDLSILDSNVMININFTKSDDYRNSLRNKKMFAGGSFLSTLSSINLNIKENIENLFEFLDKTHSSMTMCNIVVALYNKDLKKLNEDEISFNEWNNAILMFDRYRALENYFNMIPGYRYKYYNGLYLSTIHQAQLILGSSYNLENTASLFSDQYEYINKYSFHSDKKLVNSGLISAPSGRGKSVLLNYIYLQYLIKFERNFHSFILDYGGSYRNLIDRLNQDLPDEDKIVYKKLSTASSEYLNVFDIEYGKPITEEMIIKKVDILIYFFKTAFKGELTETESILLNLSLQEMYKKILFTEEGKKRDYSQNVYDQKAYIDTYIESGYKDIEAFLNAMPTIIDLPAIMNSTPSIRNSFDEQVIKLLNDKLSNFTKTTTSKVFTQKSTSIITNKHIVIDIKDLIASDSSGYLATLYFIFYAQNRYMQFIDEDIKSDKKMFMIDEYPRILKATPAVEDFVDMLLKTGRKEGIDTYLVSQNINTYNQDFFENVGNVIMFRPNTEKEVEKIKDYLGVDDDFIEPINNITSIPGEYSEIFVISMSGDALEKTILRLRLNEFDIKYLTL